MAAGLRPADARSRLREAADAWEAERGGPSAATVAVWAALGFLAGRFPAARRRVLAGLGRIVSVAARRRQRR